MQNEAIVVCDSVNRASRITTIKITTPIWVWYEVLTHRQFCRNAASTRAMSFEKFRQNCTAKPSVFTKYERTMASNVEVDPDGPNEVWERARDWAGVQHCRMEALGVSKQDTNILMLPFWNVQGLITSTNWDNFFALRTAETARPDMQILAKNIREALNNSTPVALPRGEWHIPFGGKLIESAARCARVSYDSKGDDRKLGERLLRDMHMSPFEHQAVSLGDEVQIDNYFGWMSQRAYIESGPRKWVLDRPTAQRFYAEYDPQRSDR